ncbi:hypothetical protein AN1220.2 [Aspergillus nidulans FGSC A4]|jgi:hypothetical protein|uniref:Uncharacterized protein n=1 Tax=Emericella nidulans (strain FGSC A4 / ATCC 38163 / CBS 112.46 / NRRL 194 / M139) TaxID=227321 RepID=Q5BE10_EMENI|nr:hypothetical protein [Aspergillus nidulans FGSC A4]EAA65813.1 hypothetical protein AN1220.2 [Aspergillus nidulans FGSC A4]CBF87909.1 TPA: hypothetical protein ANIA_01220 [Aspergillus nidulans FGSC A4]|eukprot:XP_658824.1 hypothetical protein AN1220.2 [Aspergillus nidulans FGSC A4]
MAVNVLSSNVSPTTTAPSTATTMNKRFPPLADRSSLSYKLTNLSKQKLAREATAPDPDIRRCLHHFRMHCLSVEWAQQETASKITSFEFEDDSESEDEEAHQGKAEQLQQKLDSLTPSLTPAPTPAPSELEVQAVNEPEAQAQAQPETPSPPKEADQTIHVHFEVAAPASTSTSAAAPAPLSDEREKDAAGGIVDKGRRCLEKAWPSPAQCMPVRIAG